MATFQNYAGGGRGRFRKNRYGHGTKRYEKDKHSKAESEDTSQITNSDVIESFRCFQVELDARNDRYERIVKLSRDITVESKRIIFLLQRVTGSEERDVILREACVKMQELRTSKFIPLAVELDGQDPYQFLRAYSPGLQEYIEAVIFHHYLANNTLASLDSIQAELIFTLQKTESHKPAATADPHTGKVKIKEQTEISLVKNETPAPISHPVTEHGIVHSENAAVSEEPALSALDGLSNNPAPVVTVWTALVRVPPTEYMLGLADFTGELMRMSINSVGSGDLDTPTVVAEMLRVIHDAFTSFGHVPRDLRQKLKVLRQSLQKVETACYALRVRGSEIPKHMLADVFATASSGTSDMFSVDENEGFYD